MGDTNSFLGEKNFILSFSTDSSTKTIKSRYGNFLIRPYQPGDEKQILQSWKLAFGQEMSLEEWYWKYPGNPSGFRCLLCLDETQRVVCHYAAQVVRICYGDEEILGLHLTDSFSHPAFRFAVGGKAGLFVRTARIFLKTYLEEIPLPEEGLKTPFPKAQFHYGFPGPRHARLGQLLLAYRIHGPGVNFFESCQVPKPPRGFWRLESSCISEFKDWPLLEDFFLRFRRTFSPFCLIRDSSYLKWRFKRPGQTYKIFCLKTFWRKKLKAWAILRTNISPTELVDFLALDEETLLLLLKHLTWEFPQGIKLWLAANHPLRGVFLRAGFRKDPTPLPLQANTRCDFSRRNPPPEAADQFFFTMADADLS